MNQSAKSSGIVKSTFATLTETIVLHLFGGKGYANEEDWRDFINETEIQNNCSHEPNYVECAVNSVGNQLGVFLQAENVYYFKIYIVFALCLIGLAILFNVIAIMAVTRVREKYPRHQVFISLSLSDLLLTIALLLKRCGDQDDVFNETTRDILANFVVFFQVGYIMSALGLLCLSLDNVLAIVAPFFYERLSIRPLSIRILIGCLWTGALTLAIVIRLCGMHKSVGVQMVAGIGMLVLLVTIISSYIFTCAQSHVHRRRLALLTDDPRVVDIRNQLRGFLTTGLLVFWCLLCWSPLVGYLLTDDDTLSSAHRFFSRYLVVALLVLHLNAVVDPVIYCLRLRDIRKSLFNLLGITSYRRRQNPSTASISKFSSRRSAPGYMQQDCIRRSFSEVPSTVAKVNVNGCHPRDPLLCPLASISEAGDTKNNSPVSSSRKSSGIQFPTPPSTNSNHRIHSRMIRSKSEIQTFDNHAIPLKDIHIQPNGDTCNRKWKERRDKYKTTNCSKSVGECQIDSDVFELEKDTSNIGEI